MKQLGENHQLLELFWFSFILGLTQLMSFCVGADDSLPENILYKGLNCPCGRLSSRPYIQLRNSCVYKTRLGDNLLPVIASQNHRACPAQNHHQLAVATNHAATNQCHPAVEV